jgi:H+/gluconate symporter-like permease
VSGKDGSELAIEKEVNTGEIAAEEIQDETGAEPETEEEREAREKREARERAEKAKKRRLIPPFVMLFAGAVTSITMRVLHYETKTMLIILLCVLVGFYIAGLVLKEMLDRFERQIEEKALEAGEVIEKAVPEDEALMHQVRKEGEA